MNRNNKMVQMTVMVPMATIIEAMASTYRSDFLQDRPRTGRRSAPKPEDAPADEVLLEIGEVCRLLGVSSATVYRYISNDRKLPAPINLGGRVRRWKETELARWMRRNKWAGPR